MLVNISSDATRLFTNLIGSSLGLPATSVGTIDSVVDPVCDNNKPRWVRDLVAAMISPSQRAMVKRPSAVPSTKPSRIRSRFLMRLALSLMKLR